MIEQSCTIRSLWLAIPAWRLSNIREQADLFSSCWDSAASSRPNTIFHFPPANAKGPLRNCLFCGTSLSHPNANSPPLSLHQSVCSPSSQFSDKIEFWPNRRWCIWRICTESARPRGWCCRCHRCCRLLLQPSVRSDTRCRKTWRSLRNLR